jgi:hypothetical protein
MKSYDMSNLKIQGMTVTVDIDGVGQVHVDLAGVKDFFTDYPHLQRDFSKGKLKGGALWFPPDIHIEPEWLIEQAEEQQTTLPIGASFKEKVDRKYKQR